jgi:hypothetical protein
MNRQDLEEKLILAKVPSHFYKLDEGFHNEAFCLYKKGSLWQVYYSERGIKTDLKTFYSENEACNYLYDLVMGENL